MTRKGYREKNGSEHREKKEIKRKQTENGIFQEIFTFVMEIFSFAKWKIVYNTLHRIFFQYS